MLYLTMQIAFGDLICDFIVQEEAEASS